METVAKAAEKIPETAGMEGGFCVSVSVQNPTKSWVFKTNSLVGVAKVIAAREMREEEKMSRSEKEEEDKVPVTILVL